PHLLPGSRASKRSSSFHGLLSSSRLHASFPIVFAAACTLASSSSTIGRTTCQNRCASWSSFGLASNSTCTTPCGSTVMVSCTAYPLKEGRDPTLGAADRPGFEQRSASAGFL